MTVPTDPTICCLQGCLMRCCNYTCSFHMSEWQQPWFQWSALYILLVNIIKMNPSEVGGHLIQDVWHIEVELLFFCCYNSRSHFLVVLMTKTIFLQLIYPTETPVSWTHRMLLYVWFKRIGLINLGYLWKEFADSCCNSTATSLSNGNWWLGEVGNCSRDGKTSALPLPGIYRRQNDLSDQRRVQV